jgi:hypothetical protein
VVPAEKTTLDFVLQLLNVSMMASESSPPPEEGITQFFLAAARATNDNNARLIDFMM